MNNKLAVLVAASLVVASGGAYADGDKKGHIKDDEVSKTYHTQRTADDQAMMSEKDTELTRRVREQIVADEKLSMNAKNIKIIAQNGKITLKGPVDSATERNKVEAIAKKVSGAKSIVNQTEVEKE